MLRRGAAAAMVAAATGLAVHGPAVMASPSHQGRHAALAPVRKHKPRGRSYRGQTSQGKSISFVVGSRHVKNLSFGLVISCASHHRYRLRASGFAPIAIHAGHFRDAVSSRHPAARATVTGRVAGRRIIGTLRLRRYVAAEHGYCVAAATYSAAR